jgi:hypothetical protein
MSAAFPGSSRVSNGQSERGEATQPIRLPEDLAPGEPAAPPSKALDFIPQPWHARLTGRRPRRWWHATRAIARYNATLPAEAAVLNFFPMRPQPQAPISLILRRLGMRVGFRPRADETTIAWDSDTWFSRRSARRLPDNAINGRCLDVSKSKVADVFEHVAGYALAVDPTRFEGRIVIKPEENGRNVGQIVEGPLLRPERGKTYERLVDCRDGNYLVTCRPVIIGSEIAITYRKWRPYPSWFVGCVLSLPVPASELLSDDEQALLLSFAAEMGMDYGELDVLRDRHSGRIYVVDANRTPGPPRNLPADMAGPTFDAMADAFRELLGK